MEREAGPEAERDSRSGREKETGLQENGWQSRKEDAE